MGYVHRNVHLLMAHKVIVKMVIPAIWTEYVPLAVRLSMGHKEIVRMVKYAKPTACVRKVNLIYYTYINGLVLKRD